MKLLLITTMLMIAFSSAIADSPKKQKKQTAKDVEYICLEIVNQK